MAVLEILKYPDSRLRRKCQPIESWTEELKHFAEDMLATMYDGRGIGLAAAQVNRLIRVLVVDVRPKEGGRYTFEGMTEMEQKVPMPMVMFNPEIVSQQGQINYDEGCLSVPTYFESVERFEQIEIKGLDLNGKPIQFVTDGLLSICLQHEIDHLDGKLFIDRLTPIRSSRIKNKIKKFGYPDPSERDADKETNDGGSRL